MDVFEHLPQAVVVLGMDGHVLARNRAAHRLFGERLERPGLRCCDLVGCGPGGDGRPARRCVTDAVTDGGAELCFELVVDGRRVEVGARPLRDGSGALLQVRPAAGGQAAADEPLHISMLGSLRLQCGELSLAGPWLDHRPGQVFKYLLCARGHPVPVEELLEAIWPDGGRTALTSLRQAVHGLRDRLEPHRSKHGPPRFVLARANAYEVDMTGVVVDADLFESAALDALLAAEGSPTEAAEAQLTHAAHMYEGDFVADEPYLECALEERDRLRSLAARVLRRLSEVHLARSDVAAATTALHRLADLEPLDLDAQRDLIALMLRRRQHSDAARRYALVRRRFRRAFGDDPDFALAELLPAPAATGSA
jgi:DNA-binding SARP family transcriptional activator